MLPMLRVSLTALVLVPWLPCQLNEKTFFNPTLATGTTRVLDATNNVLFQVPPAQFRIGHGGASGVTATLRDTDQATAEQIIVGYGRLKNGLPDPNAPITAAVFTAFGSGSGAKTMRFQFTFAAPIALPERSSLFIILPGAKSAQDKTEIAYQEGSQLKLPAWAPQERFTYYLDEFAAVRLFRSVGTTIDLGGLFEEPVVGIYNRTKAYGPYEDLPGPDCHYIDTARPDQLRWYVRAQSFAKQLALIGISFQRAASPIKTPYGPILIGSLGFFVFANPVLLDDKGFGKSTILHLPVGLKAELWCQSTLIHLNTLRIRTSDACSTRTR